MRFFRVFCVIIFVGLFASCGTLGGTVVKAEEYFSIASAYFELGKLPEAERWFNLARQYEKTKFAAEYNLARIAFQKNEPEDAAHRFEALLKHDPSNTMLLRAAAYSWMKAEKWDNALTLFEQISDMLPETEDARYNYALALSSADRFEDAVEKLKPYVARRTDDREALLLLARTEKKLKRPEAADRFAAALKLKDEGSVRLELAETFEDLRLYARALETYRSLKDGSADLPKVGKGDLRFRAARVMLFAGEDPSKSLEELRGAVSDGFKDVELMNKLAEDSRLPETLQAPISELLSELEAKQKEAEKNKKEKQASEKPAPDALAHEGTVKP